MATIQVISQTDYTVQHIAPVFPMEPALLPASSVRIRTRLISLTTNNFGYAKLGGFRFPGLAWWDVWRMQSVMPPFNDESTYCRISAWGYSEIVESNISDLPVGTQLFGYQPIGTAAEVLELRKARVDGHWLEVSKRREGLIGIYNRYEVFKGDGNDTEEDRASSGWDSLMKFLFEAAWSLNRFGFDETGESLINPKGLGDWSAEEASLEEAVVVLLAASGKTGISFAHQLKQRRPGKGPKKVIALGSSNSRVFSTEVGLFDEVLEYNDIEKPGFNIDELLGCDRGKVLLVNFGARGNAADKWAEVLRLNSNRFQAILVGTDPQADFPGSKLASLVTDPTSGVIQMNAGVLRENGIVKLGEEKFFSELNAAWDKFKADGGVPGLKMVWRKGMVGVKESWDALAGGEYGPDMGLLIELE